MFDRPDNGGDPFATGGADHGAVLDLLARADPAATKAEAERLLPLIGAVAVLQSRTGLVMLPMRDTVRGTDFHLGEVLVAEARLRLTDHGAEGYGMIVGRDLEQAMAMALIDAAWAAGIATDGIAAFLDAARVTIRAADAARLRQIEATRVSMETF